MNDEWVFPPEPVWLHYVNKVLRWAFHLTLIRHVQVSTKKIVALSLSIVRPNYTKGLGLVWTKKL